MMEKKLVSPMRKLTEEEKLQPSVMPPRRSHEEISYIILAVFRDDAREQTFRIAQGREDATEEGRLLTLDNADLNDSRVFMDHQTINESISLYWFMKRMMELGMVKDTSFDVDDFMEGDSNETVLEANEEGIPEQISSMYTEEEGVDQDIYNV